MIPYIQRDLFPAYHLVRLGVDTKEIHPSYPDPARTRPVVIHSPSAPVAKGTAAVLTAVKLLKEERGLDFEFRLIQDKPREEALHMLKDADVFLDQFVLCGHGMASVEAMAMGKPVVSYIAPTRAGLYPSDMPIVSATKDNLAGVLAVLLRDGGLRHEIGLRSRTYVEKYHDAKTNAQQLIGIYENLLKGRRLQ